MEKQRKGITGMKRTKDIEITPRFVKDMLRALIKLNNYPDISITYYFDSMYRDYCKVEAELVLCSGDRLSAEALILKDELTDDKVKHYLEKALLKEIAYRYISRAFKKRKNGEVTEKAGHYIKMLSIVKEEVLDE